MKNTILHQWRPALAFFMALWMVLSPTLGVLPLGTGAVDDPFAGWDISTWTQSSEEGEPILSGQPAQSINNLPLNGTMNGNSLRFSVRMEDAYGTVDGNFGLVYKCPSGDRYFFEYNTVAKVARVRRLPIGGGDQHVGSAVSLTLGVGEWYDYDIRVEEGLLRWSIDGQVIQEVTDTGADSFDGGTAYFSSYNTTISLKNILIGQVSDSETDPPVEPPVEPGTNPAEAFSDWTLGTWTATTEDGIPTLTGDRNQMINDLNLIDTTGTNNTLRFSVRVNDAYSTVDGNVGAVYRCPSRDRYFFEYNTAAQIVRIRRIGVDGTDNHVGSAKSLSLELGTWYDFEIRYTEGLIRWSINGETLYEITDTGADVMTGGTMYLSSYNATASLRNLTLIEETIDRPETEPVVTEPVTEPAIKPDPEPELDPEKAFAQWNTENWTRSTEDGIPIITSKNGNAVNTLPLEGIVEGNNLFFSVRVNDVHSTVDGNVGAVYTCTSGDRYFFEYNTVSEIVRVRRLGAAGGDNHVGSAKSYKLEKGQWYNFDIYFQENYLRWCIDGKEIFEITDTGTDSFAGGTVRIQSYNTTASVKNIHIESEKIEIVPKQTYDFEFKTADSVKGFSVLDEKGSISWADGKLTYTLGGAGTRLVSPPISVEPGDTYAALLPLRNTVFVRLKNDTAAQQVRVYYTSTNSLGYSEDKSAVFDVRPHSDYTSYFFNLSDCKTVSGGYLYGFAIEPIGATSGTMSLEAVTFEREAVMLPAIGTLLSCTATEETVTIKGTLEPAYVGKTVRLYETMPENYGELLKDSEMIAEVTADGAAFTVTVPFKVGEMTRLSSLFLLGVDGQKLGSRFTIENYEDFTDNPYAFDLPDYEVKVTDFGAKGDAFTNDTAAIQAAIDHVSAKGGGRVTVPGDDSRYGRRYVATNIKLKDNVDLHLEEGAILWQSPRIEDYDYNVLPGHDIVIPGVNWTHTASCHNMPLVQGSEVKNIKLTGKGIIRMDDTGSENQDSVSAGTLWTGCEGRLHLTPVGLWKCENVELSGFGLRRTNNYHINLRTCDRAYVANVTMWEVTCASGDGIAVTIGSKNVTVDRCFFYSNDDAITICSTYDDPRGLAWWFTNPGGDNGIHNLTVRHSNLNGGHGITFIPWGTDAPDVSLQEIRNINVYDNVLSGGTCSVGSWPDNPYYGKTPYDNTETDDFSPVKDVRIYNNRYRGKTTLDCIRATNFISDSGIQSAKDFQYGNFERGDGRHRDWVSGLSNWSTLTAEGELLHTETNTSTAVEGKNHYGVIKSSGILAQGLYMSKGEHTFTIDTRFAKGDATLVVIDAISGETLAEKKLTASDAFRGQTLTFTCEKGTTAYLGVRYKGDGEVHIDNAKVTSETFKQEPYFTERFEDPDALQINNQGFTLREEDGSTAAVVPVGSSGLMMLQTPSNYKEFDLHLKLRYDGCASTIDANFGISFRRASSADQYNMNYGPLTHTFMARSYTGGAVKMIHQQNGDFPVGEWMDIAVRVQDGKCLWYLNGEELMSYDVDSRTAAPIAIVAYNINCAIKDVQIAPAGSTRITGDEVIEESTTPPETETPDELTDTTGPDSGDEATAPDGSNDTTEPGGSEAETDAPKKKGCQSALAGGTLALLAGAALTLSRRRRRD